MTNALNSTTTELFNQYEWFNQAFKMPVQAASDDFLAGGIEFKLASVSKNMNALFQEDSYFVTKIKVDNFNEVYIRCSDKAVRTILERSLGPSKRPFDINKITELEAKLITAYNDNLYNFVSSAFTPSTQPLKKVDITHLTFLIKDPETNLGGKIIFSFPSQLVNAQNIVSQEEKFTYDFFSNSLVDVNILIGTTEFTVKDLKSLEPEDIIVLENSNIQTMHLRYGAYNKDFRITPNPALIISVDNSEGEDMATNMPPENLWDSIQVEMGAEFDKVKISLGELKNIEQGLVVDIGSVYQNNITLKVEEKTIAIGELVIVNDRYGVKINKIFAEPKPQQEEVTEEYPQEQMPLGEEIPQEHQEIGEEMPTGYDEMPPQEDVQGDEDFDYSDFELEDEDI